MGDQLSAADRSALVAERHRSITMAVGGVIITEAGHGVTYDALCRRIIERLHLVPRLRHRLHEPGLDLGQVGLGGQVNLGRAMWIEDEHFDVRWHVRLHTLPQPRDDEALAAYVGQEFSRRMDRTRPLWEMHVVEGLAPAVEGGGERVAVVCKLHHALVDGMSALALLLILLDLSPEPEAVPPPTPSEPKPERTLIRRQLSRWAGKPLSLAQGRMMDGAGWMLDQTPRSAASDLTRASEVGLHLLRGRPVAPELPFNTTISPNRAFAMASVPLPQVKEVAKPHGATVNDWILAAVCGMLANYLASCGIVLAELPRDPVALVPVSVRKDGDTGGNRISVVFVDLPVGEPDPIRRMGLIADQTAKIKGSPQVIAGALLVGMSGFVPPLLASSMATVMARGESGPAVNLVVSNVPGPQLPLYVNGATVLALYSVVPLNPVDQGLNLGVLSYNGTVFFSISADKALDPPIQVAADSLRAGIDELLSP